MSLPRAVVAGLAGAELTPDEAALFTRHPVAGFILFQRNCATPVQLRALTRSLEELYPDRWVPILIDHEGGRVQRMKPPHWPARPAAGRIGAVPGAARELAAHLWASLLAADLVEAGINVDCVPVLDVARPETTKAIGDRAFAADAATVASLGRLVMQTMQAAGVVPVIKHLPGHGRARVDTHLELPRLEVGLDELRQTDFVPFKACCHAPFAMTAHIVFTAVDAKRPATQSRKVIDEIIRGEIGFEGILFSDDLSMQALSGSIEERASLSLEAGCDLALHCNGDLAEMQRLLPVMPKMRPERFGLLQAASPTTVSHVDWRRVEQWAGQLDMLLGHAV